jgi:hypothetical protein
MSDQDKNDSNTLCLICSDDCDENKNYQTFPKDETNCECVYTIHDECLQLLKKNWGTKCPICQKENEDVIIEVRRIRRIEQIEENQNRLVCRLKYLFYFLIIGLIIGIGGTLLAQSDVL